MMNTAKKSAYSTLINEFNLMIDEPLKKYTSFKIGGPADLLALPESEKGIQRIMTRAADLDVPVTIFGGGTNLLIRDKGIRGLVILTRKLKSGIRIDESDNDQKIVQADAGEKLAVLCRFTNENGLSGLEFAAGIPGTLGGALMMNAGIPDHRISDPLVSLKTLDPSNMKIKTIDRQALKFSYRKLECAHITLGARFKLIKTDPKNVQERYQVHLENKKKTQPVSLPSAGCFFKNPEKAPAAGKLIEDAGLKGTKRNDAMVSKVHANYIVNTGQATCADVLLLQETIQNKVYNTYHVKLETEVRIEGEK